jgi:hypothetical protein
MAEPQDIGNLAKSRGLHHIGWGRYADKQGNVVAKSVDGRLVNIPKGEKDPVVDQPSADIEDMPNDKRPDVWKGWKPKSSAGEDDLRPYRGVSRASDAMMGSSWEEKFRKLPPGDVAVDKGSNNPYVARNPDGKLASFSHDVIAAAFSQGKSLKGYDFDKNYVGSMEKLKKELKPIMDKFEKQGKKNKFRSFVKDLFVAFIQGASAASDIGSSGKKSGGFKFGGGGGFSGGGSSGKF